MRPHSLVTHTDWEALGRGRADLRGWTPRGRDAAGRRSGHTAALGRHCSRSFARRRRSVPRIVRHGSAAAVLGFSELGVTRLRAPARRLLHERRSGRPRLLPPRRQKFSVLRTVLDGWTTSHRTHAHRHRPQCPPRRERWGCAESCGGHPPIGAGLGGRGESEGLVREVMSSIRLERRPRAPRQ